jgi:hypothetical protein
MVLFQTWDSNQEKCGRVENTPVAVVYHPSLVRRVEAVPPVEEK